jgi:Co/Zn/Cd efflux system component
MIDDVSMAGFILAVFVFGITVGKFVEKIERLIREKEDEEHRNAHKNDRR